MAPTTSLLVEHERSDMNVPEQVSVNPVQVEALVRVLGLPPQEAVDAAIKGFLKVFTWMEKESTPHFTGVGEGVAR